MVDTEAERTVAWCAGLRFVENRRLTVEELAAFRHVARRSGQRGWWLLSGIPIGFGAIIGLGFLLKELPAAVPLTAGLFGLHMLLGTSILISLARDAFRDRRAFREGAQAGYVCRYEGAIGQGDAPDPAARSLIKRGFLRADPSASQTLEILPVSGVVWRANDVQPSRWTRATTAQVAEPPESAARAAEWVKPLVTDSGVPFYGRDREMSAPEREELRRYARKALWGRLPYALLGNALLLQAMWNPSMKRSWWIVAAAAIAAIATYQLILNARTGFDLRRDLRMGRIMIVRESRETGQTKHATPELSPPREVLPISGILWTDNGRPAPWRTGGG